MWPNNQWVALIYVESKKKLKLINIEASSTVQALPFKNSALFLGKRVANHSKTKLKYHSSNSTLSAVFCMEKNRWTTF